MLKVLLHGNCSYDCAYCSVRACRERVGFAPRELAETFLSLYRAGTVNGLFLSSGIPEDAGGTMADMVGTARILRAEGYGGYLHLKILPGAGRSDIAEAARYADRISLNAESTGASRLRAISGIKDYSEDIQKRLGWIAAEAPGRHTTQLVVGAAGETDAEIFSCMADLYGTVQPARIYYSAFQPLPGTRFAEKPGTPPWRAHRWYQVDTLFREYGYKETELSPLVEDGMLANADPKVLLAQDRDPVDPATATYEELLRVPGIGPVTARVIVEAREYHPIRQPQDLDIPPAYLKRAMPYLVFAHGTIRQATLAGFS
jgi:Predicted DNA-binding protein with the Helix-hairpin-helix motif